MSKPVTFHEFANSDNLAVQIADKFVDWESERARWVTQTNEARQYVFATSVAQTSAGKLGWKNTVHIPKVCQIRDNLYANYMAALFPNDKSIAWEGADEESDTQSKRKAIEAYMRNKLRESDFTITLAQCVLDWIDYGNTFGIIDYVDQKIEDSINKTTNQGYVGPKFRRLSPFDIVFDPTAVDFEASPKIVRSLVSLGGLKSMIEDQPDAGYLEEVFNKAIDLRRRVKAAGQSDVQKNSYYQMDGFSSYTDYLASDTVELLDFYGDIYDSETEEFHKQKILTVVDRCYIIRNITNPSWLGKAPIFHCGWRLRPDNLYAMGPLDNLIGLQHRIDHLENAKADGVDLMIHPVLKIRGFVEDFEYGPNARIEVGDTGDVEFMHPDAAILQLDTQIAMYEMKMEEMAGSPKQAMGFRTPGEKTAHEVQILDQAANKIFINKTSYFEEVFMEKVLNAMLEVGRRSIGPAETIRVEDEDLNFEEFIKVTRDDLAASGKIRPIGARRFARNANTLQNLTQLSATPLWQDPAVLSHVSGKRIAKLLESILNLEQFNIIEANVRVVEMAETMKMQSNIEQVMIQEGTPPNAIPGEAPQQQGSAARPPQGSVTA